MSLELIYILAHAAITLGALFAFSRNFARRDSAGVVCEKEKNAGDEKEDMLSAQWVNFLSYDGSEQRK